MFVAWPRKRLLQLSGDQRTSFDPGRSSWVILKEGRKCEIEVYRGEVGQGSEKDNGHVHALVGGLQSQASPRKFQSCQAGEGEATDVSQRANPEETQKTK